MTNTIICGIDAHDNTLTYTRRATKIVSLFKGFGSGE